MNVQSLNQQTQGPALDSQRNYNPTGSTLGKTGQGLNNVRTDYKRRDNQSSHKMNLDKQNQVFKNGSSSAGHGKKVSSIAQNTPFTKQLTGSNLSSLLNTQGQSVASTTKPPSSLNQSQTTPSASRAMSSQATASNTVLIHVCDEAKKKT